MDEKTKKRPIEIELTPEQRELIKRATGRDVPVLEISPDELEERVAPAHALVLSGATPTDSV